MAKHRLSIPLGEEEVRTLRIGDMVWLDGKVHTGRALVYQHVLEGGHEPPLDLANESNVQMHGAPAAVEDAPGEYRLSSIQATASFRYWKYVPDYVERFGIRAVIGKGGMDKWVYEDVFARTGTVFLTTVGYGIAALYGRAVKRVVDVHWKEELGLPEAMWVLEVENFGPFIVDGDCTGASLAALAIDKVNPNFAREYAKLPDYVLKRIGEIDDSLAVEVIVGRPEGERVSGNGETILERPDDKDREDAERLTQTHLEQVSENQKFRVLARFFESVRYLHIVPHVVREFRRDGDYRGDPFGSDFLEQIAATNKRSRESRLKKIQEALRAAVPQFERLELERDLTGDWHLYADYKHWQPKAARQNEATFSDGTLRLLGLLWSLAEQGGPLLLEEPELSLHDALVSRLAPIMARMNRKTGRQVLVTTHSVALLRDRGIDLREIHLLDPGEEGTIVRRAADFEDVATLIEQGLSPGEAIMPRAAARDVHQLSLSF